MPYEFEKETIASLGTLCVCQRVLCFLPVLVPSLMVSACCLNVVASGVVMLLLKLYIYIPHYTLLIDYSHTAVFS